MQSVDIFGVYLYCHISVSLMVQWLLNFNHLNKFLENAIFCSTDRKKIIIGMSANIIRQFSHIKKQIDYELDSEYKKNNLI